MSYYGINLKGNEEQIELARLISDTNHEIVFCTGNAGTGKTFTTLVVALELTLLQKKYDKIIYARNPIQLGESMGFLPGDVNEKYNPFMGGLFDNLESICKKSSLKPHLTDVKSKIEIVPLAFLRGRSLENTILIIDEAQNCDLITLKAVLTRMGQYSKIVLLGSMNQIDDPHQRKKEKCDFEQVIAALNDLDYVAVMELIKSMRSPHCGEIDECLRKLDNVK